MTEHIDEQKTCLFCNQPAKRKLCRQHGMVVCPRCGYQAHWMGSKYACFRTSPWCDWTGTKPPNTIEVLTGFPERP